MSTKKRMIPVVEAQPLLSPVMVEVNKWRTKHGKLPYIPPRVVNSMGDKLRGVKV